MKFTKESISEVKNAQFSLLIFLYRLYKAILAHFDQNRLKLSRKKNYFEKTGNQIALKS